MFSVSEVENLQKLEKANNFDKFLSSTYLYSALLTGVVHCSKPLLENFAHFLTVDWEDFHYSKVLPLKAGFFYDATKSPLYELTFLFICSGTYVTSIMSVNFNLNVILTF